MASPKTSASPEVPVAAPPPAASPSGKPVETKSPASTASLAPPARGWRRNLVIAAILVVVLPVGYLRCRRSSWRSTRFRRRRLRQRPRDVRCAARCGASLKVLVDDNYRVKKGDLLVQLDPEPYRIVVEIKQAAVVVAEANLVEANAQVRAVVGQARAHRYNLEYAIDQVNDQIANLRASVATLNSRKASLELAQEQSAAGRTVGAVRRDQQRRSRRASADGESRRGHRRRSVAGDLRQSGQSRFAGGATARPGFETWFRRTWTRTFPRSARRWRELVESRRAARILPHRLGRDAEGGDEKVLRARSARRSESHLRAH